MAAAIRGYRMLLIMPEDLSRRARADDEGVRRRADPHAALAAAWSTRATWPSRCRRDGKGRVLDQFANADNPRIHYETTGPEIWHDTDGRITHFVSAMGTTGTITGVSRFLKEKNPAVRIIGAQPSEGSRIPGIRKWPRGVPAEDLRPDARSTSWCCVSQADAEEMARRLAREEGIFAGISAAGACWVALQIAETGARTRPSSSSSATAATATCRPACSPRDAHAHELKFCPHCADAAARRSRSTEDGGAEGAPALPGLRLDALEQPDAGAGRGDRVRRPRRPACCWRAMPPGRARCSR